jgi:hypothetical protein
VRCWGPLTVNGLGDEVLDVCLMDSKSLCQGLSQDEQLSQGKCRFGCFAGTDGYADGVVGP